MDNDYQRLKEQAENLTGQRGAPKKPLSAVRRGELLALAARAMQSDQVTASPTMADFNALQADIAAIYTALAQISNALGNAKFL